MTTSIGQACTSFLEFQPAPPFKSKNAKYSCRTYRVLLECLPDLRPHLDLKAGFTTSGEVCQKLAALQIDVAVLHAARVLAGEPIAIEQSAVALRLLGEFYVEALRIRGNNCWLELEWNENSLLICKTKNARVREPEEEAPPE